jgi:hypothetical protein
MTPETLRPTWAELLPMLMNKAAAGDKHAIAEMRRMARAADLAVAMRAYRSATAEVLA